MAATSICSDFGAPKWQATSVLLLWESHEQYEKAKRYDTERRTPHLLLGAQYATGDQWRNNSRKNEGMEPKQKQYHTSTWCMLMYGKTNTIL